MKKMYLLLCLSLLVGNMYAQKKSKRLLKETAFGANIKMVYVKGGSFMMGCTSEQDSDCADREKPVHTVSVDGFYIGKYEVTQAQWKAVMGTNPSHFANCDQCPVETISWNDTQEFIQKLNQQTGKTYRLPTEAEWEYAARGGNRDNGYVYAGSNSLGEVAEYADNNNKSTKPVGGKASNQLGLYDMLGNAWEWCEDVYDANYYTNSPSSNPRNTSSSEYRALRGGCWCNAAKICRISSRHFVNPAGAGYSVGFRLVLVP